MLKSEKNPGGTPLEAFDGLRAALLANRAQFYIDLPTGPFYGFNRKDAKVSQGLIDNWWRQGMMGGAKAHYDCIKAFSETDFTEDLKTINVPVLLMHGDDDQIVPIADSAEIGIKLLKKGQLKGLQGPAPRAWPPPIPRSSTPTCSPSSRAEASGVMRRSARPDRRALFVRPQATFFCALNAAALMGEQPFLARDSAAIAGVSDPSAPITRWQGTTTLMGLSPLARHRRRAPPSGRPLRAASSV